MPDLSTSPPVEITSALVADIRAFLERSGMRPKTLARECGLGDETLRNVLRDNWNPRLETLRAVERYIAAHEAAPSNRAA